MFVSVDPVCSRWCAEIKVGEKFADVGWPCEQSNKRRSYHGKLFRTRHDPKEFVKNLELGMFA